MMSDEPDLSALREEVLTILAALIHSRGLSIHDFYALLGIDASKLDEHKAVNTAIRLGQIIKGFPDIDPHR
jgi:hypothetical protein